MSGFFRKWMQVTGWKTNELADLLGVSRQTIYAWKQGDSRPSAEALAKLEVLSKGEITARSFVSGARSVVVAQRLGQEPQETPEDK